MSDEPEERIQKIAEHHQVIAKILTCPICLELLLSPTRTKCGHVFCQGCLEDHIKKGKRGRASCPLCNTEGITKRGLERDATVTGLVAVFKKLVQAEKNDMGNVVDFMNIRIQRKGARESVATPQKEQVNVSNKLTAIQKIGSDIHCSFSEDGDSSNFYGDILDTIGSSTQDSADDKDKVASISQHGIKKLKLKSTSAGSIKPSPLSATPSLSTTLSLESGGASPVRSVKTSTTPRVWNKMKPKGPKTYSKSSGGRRDEPRARGSKEMSQVYPGEAVEGDKEWEENRKTSNSPILGGVDREEKVEEWLKTEVDGFGSPESGQFVDLCSQPSLSQGTESTPSVAKGVRPSPDVSPLDGAAMRGGKAKFFKSKAGSLSGVISKEMLIKGAEDEILGQGADDKILPSQPPPLRPKGRGRGRGRGKVKKDSKESGFLSERIRTKICETSNQDGGKSKKKNSKDMYENQDELWSNFMNSNNATKVETSGKSPDESQIVPNSCPVMDDTFDRVAVGVAKKKTIEKENVHASLEEDDETENESCGLFQSPPDLLDGSETAQVVNKKSSSKNKESLEDFLNRDDKESQPLQVKKKVSWQDDNTDVKRAKKIDNPILGKENGGKIRTKKSTGGNNVNFGSKASKENTEIENMAIDSIHSEPVLEQSENEKTKVTPEGSLTDSVPSMISNSQASKEDLTNKRRSFPPKMKRDEVSKLVAMVENDLEGEEAEIAGLYSSTETNNTSEDNAKNLSSKENGQVGSQHEMSSGGRMTFQLDVETMELEEMAKPMDTLELVTQAITDSPIKCKTPTTVRRSGRPKCTPTSVLQSPSPGKTPQQVRSRRIAPLVGFASPTEALDSPTDARAGSALGFNGREKENPFSSSQKSVGTILSGSSPGEMSKPFDALNSKDSLSSDTIDMSIGFTISPAVQEKASQKMNSIENISQNIEKVAKIPVKSRFSFKLLGKVRSTPPAKPRRDRNVIFTQSGRLAEKRHGPSLREIVSRPVYSSAGSVHQLTAQDQSTPAASSKVRNWLHNLETPTSLLSGPRLVLEETPTVAERVLVLETPTPANTCRVMETPTPAQPGVSEEQPGVPGVSKVDTTVTEMGTPVNNRVIPQMASIQIQTSQGLLLKKKNDEVEATGDEMSMDMDEDKNTAVTDSSATKVNGTNTKLKRKKGKPKKDPYENPKPGTSGLSSTRVTRGRASKSSVSSTRIVEVARSHLDSDSDGAAPPLARKKSSGSSGKKSSKLSVAGIMSRIVPGDSDDMRIENIDTATSVEEEGEEIIKQVETTGKKESTSDVEPDLPDFAEDKKNDERAVTPNLATALGVEEDDLANALDMDELPDINVVPGNHSKFMTDILGESEPHVYSQDVETVSHQIARVAKLEFERDQENAPSRGGGEGNRKRSRKMSSSSEHEPVTRKRRRTKKIESDEEDTVVVSDHSSPAKPISKLDSLKKKIGGGSFENSFKSLDQQMEQGEEIEAISSQPLTQTGYWAEEMQVPAMEEQDTLGKENGNFMAPTSNTKTTVSRRTVLGEVTNSPARSTGLKISQSKISTKMPLSGISCLTDKDESQMTRRSSSISSLATSTDSEDDRTTQEIQRDVEATEMQIMKMKRQMVSGAEVLASHKLAHDIKENALESQGDDMEAVAESVNLLQNEPTTRQTEDAKDSIESHIESVEVAETEDEESAKIVESDDDLFISQTPEETKPIRYKGKKPGDKLDTVVEIDDLEITPSVASKVGEIDINDYEQVTAANEHSKVAEFEGQMKAASQVTKVEEFDEQETAASEDTKVLAASEDRQDTSKWKFVTTNLPPSSRQLVSKWVGSLNCKGICSKIDEDVTHVIVSTDPDLQSQRTLKYLQAVASGKMVLSDLWVKEAVRLGSIPKEEEYEVKDEENGGANGPWRSRMARQSGKPGIFNKFEVLISEELEGLSAADVEDLLVRAGARCVPDENAFSFSPHITPVIIADSAASMDAKVVNRRLRVYKMATVEKDWLLDSLGDWAARPLLPYMMDQVTVEDLVTAGYTGRLTEPEI